MPHSIALSIVFALISFLLSPVIEAQQPTKFIPTDPNQSIMLPSAKSEFSLTLPANPTTGYTWHIASYDDHLVTVTGHKFFPPSSQIVGAGGFDVWTFKVSPSALVAPHLLKIKMVYGRSWDIRETGQEKEFFVITE